MARMELRTLPNGEYFYYNTEDGGTLTGFGTTRLWNTAGNLSIYFDSDNGHVDNAGSNVNIYSDYSNGMIWTGGNNVNIQLTNGISTLITEGDSVQINATGNAFCWNAITGNDISINLDSGDDFVGGGEDGVVTNSTINVGAGNDTVNIGGGGYNINIDAGEGDDYVGLVNTSIVTVNAGVGNDKIFLGGSYNLIEYANGDGNDYITGFKDNDTINISNTTYSQYISGNDWVISAGDGSITLVDAASISPVIVGSQDSSSVAEDENNYTYYGGDVVIDNYTEGEQINLAGDFIGIGLDDNNFYVNSSSGTLMIQNVRDKVIGYGTADGNLIAHSFMASYGGDIDFRNVPQFEIIIGASNQDNQIYAGSGGSSMWGGVGGNDTLVGGDGYDEFFFAQGCGGDVIQNAGDNDIVNLLGVTFDQITAVNVSEFSVNVTFADGSYLNVEGNSNVGYRLEGKVYACNNSTGEWYEK